MINEKGHGNIKKNFLKKNSMNSNILCIQNSILTLVNDFRNIIENIDLSVIKQGISGFDIFVRESFLFIVD